jgi:hypothetical protein
MPSFAAAGHAPARPPPSSTWLRCLACAGPRPFGLDLSMLWPRTRESPRQAELARWLGLGQLLLPYRLGWDPAMPVCRTRGRRQRKAQPKRARPRPGSAGCASFPPWMAWASCPSRVKAKSPRSGRAGAAGLAAAEHPDQARQSLGLILNPPCTFPTQFACCLARRAAVMASAAGGALASRSSKGPRRSRFARAGGATVACCSTQSRPSTDLSHLAPLSNGAFSLSDSRGRDSRRETRCRRPVATSR